jgi:hypothetical protein
MIGERLRALLFHPAIDREASAPTEIIAVIRSASRRSGSGTAPGSETGETRQDG